MFATEKVGFGFFSFPVDWQDRFMEVSYDEDSNKIILLIVDVEKTWSTNSVEDARILLALLNFNEVYNEKFSLVCDPESNENFILNVTDISLIISDEERNNIIWCLNKVIGRVAS